MEKKIKKLFKNLGVFTIGSFASKFVSFLFVPLYTAVLTTEEYGSVDILYSTISMLTPIFLLSIQDATLRFCMDKEYESKDVVSTTMNIIFKGTLLLFIGNVILYLLGFFHLKLMEFIFFYFIFFIGAINSCLTLYLKAKNKAKVIAVSGILNTIVNCVSNILFLVCFKLGVNGFMLSNILALAVQFLYQLIFGKVYEEIRITGYKNLSKPMIRYSKPLIANSMSWWINNASDRYLIVWLLDVGMNGIYSISYKIPTILTTFQGIFYNAWSISAISEYDPTDKDGFLGKNYTYYSLISIGVCSLLLVVNIPLASILYTGSFFEAWKCVPFLLIGTIFNGISQFEGALFAAVKKTKEVSITTMLGALCNTVLNLILIPIIGILGAASATMIGYGVMWIGRTEMMKKFVDLKVNWKVHYLSIFLIIIQSILATINCNILIQILIILLLIILNRNIILNFLNSAINLKFIKQSNE